MLAAFYYNVEVQTAPIRYLHVYTIERDDSQVPILITKPSFRLLAIILSFLTYSPCSSEAGQQVRLLVTKPFRSFSEPATIIVVDM
jgi:hypothetical protein